MVLLLLNLGNFVYLLRPLQVPLIKQAAYQSLTRASVVVNDLEHIENKGKSWDPATRENHGRDDRAKQTKQRCFVP
jgi:hypothetical protein